MPTAVVCPCDAYSLPLLPRAQMEMDLGYSIHFLFHDDNPYLESHEMAVFCLAGGEVTHCT